MLRHQAVAVEGLAWRGSEACTNRSLIAIWIQNAAVGGPGKDDHRPAGH